MDAKKLDDNLSIKEPCIGTIRSSSGTVTDTFSFEKRLIIHIE